MSPVQAVSRNAPALEATMLQPSYELSAAKVSAAIADQQTAANAILIGTPNPPSRMTEQEQHAQSKFLLRTIIAQVKQVLEKPSGALLAEKLTEVKQQSDALLRDTPDLLAQYRRDLTAATEKATKVGAAVEKILGKGDPHVNDLVTNFLAKVQGTITPVDPLNLRQAELRFAQNQLAQAVVGAAADDSNTGLLGAIVKYGKTKFEGHLPTTPREIGNELGWVRVDEIAAPNVSASDRTEAHKRVLADRTKVALREVAEVVDYFAIHPQKFISSPLSPAAVASIPVGESRLIGRQPTADLVVNDRQVSGAHLLLERKGQTHWALFDNESTNGTYVNGNQILPNTLVEVSSGTAVSIGSTRFVLP